MLVVTRATRRNIPEDAILQLRSVVHLYLPQEFSTSNRDQQRVNYLRLLWAVSSYFKVKFLNQLKKASETADILCDVMNSKSEKCYQHLEESAAFIGSEYGTKMCGYDEL
jgi:hypothetical protein